MVVKHGGRGPGHLSRWPKAASGASLSALALDFTDMDAAGLSAAGVTFSRATGPSTRVNSSGYIESVANGAPRFHHDWDGTPLGLLIEEERENLRTQSDPAEGLAPNNGSMVADYAASPDGTSNASRLIDDNAGGVGLISWNGSGNLNSLTLEASYASTIYAKADQLSWLAQNVSNYTTPPTGRVYFNLSAGTVGTEETDLTGYIEECIAGWYRPSVVFTLGAVDQHGKVEFQLSDGDGNINIDRDGTSSVLLYGVQFEQGAFPTTLIPTTGSAQTRPAESAVMSDISEWWNDTAATVVATFRSPGVGNRVVWSMDDGAGDIISLATVGTDLVLALYDGGVPIASITLGTITPNTTHKAAVSFAADDLQGSLDGATKVTETDTGGALPVVDRLRIGSTTAGAHLCGPIAEVVVYDTLEDVEALAA